MGNEKMTNGLSWSFLIHLGYNMWASEPLDRAKYDPVRDRLRYASKELRCDDALWRECTDRLAAGGIDMLLIDVGEGVVYPSHPELTVKGGWSPERMRGEVRRLRALGVEAIPKLNFSATHDAWLGEYGRMVSTPEYYRVCSDLIGDALEMFDHPRMLHIGMDEEGAKMQRGSVHMCIRQGELWWHDFNFLVKEVERRGSRAWTWTDLADFRDNLPEFFDRMPKSVVQSPCFYGKQANLEGPFKYSHERYRLEFIMELDKHGYDQIVTGTTYCPPYYEKGEDNTANFGDLSRFCVRHVSKERLMSMLMAPWHMTHPNFRERLFKAIDLTIAARRDYLASIR